MARGVYDIGDICRISASFTDNTTGLPVDPASITFRSKNPLGSVGTYIYGGASPPVRSATGQFYLDLLLTVSGASPWRYRWDASGPPAAEEGTLPVASSAFP